MNNSACAIVGIGCRYPGGIDSPDTFWDSLVNAKDCITSIPGNRWSLDKFYSANKNQKNRLYMHKGGFLDDIDKFDPQFFGISPREAEYMDPQQRLLLEVTWHAFEDAGYVPATYPGKVGVFGGTGAAWHLNKVHSHPSVTQFASGASIVTNNDKDYVTTN